MQIITPHTGVCLDRQVMLTTGVFDGVHRGHVHLLGHLRREAEERGMVPMAVTFRNHPLEVIDPSRAPKHLTSLAERMALMELTGVSLCLLLEFDGDMMSLGAVEFINMLKDRINVGALMAGYNNRIGRKDGPMLEEACRKCGVQFVRSTEHSHDGSKISSSRIRTMLSEGEVQRANEALGRHYRLSGVVTHGREIGRTIGFPTANISTDSIDPRKLLPMEGAYACTASINGHAGTLFPAMVNIGTNPTIDCENRKVSVEVNIIGLEAGLYGKTITLGFMERLRPERRFESLDELKVQLEADRREVIRIFANNSFKP